jgi:hypothetical protein
MWERLQARCPSLSTTAISSSVNPYSSYTSRSIRLKKRDRRAVWIGEDILDALDDRGLLGVNVPCGELAARGYYPPWASRPLLWR